MLERPEKFVSTAERDAHIEPDVLRLIDAGYQTEVYEVMVRVNDAIAEFNRQLESEYTRPVLKHSMFWHKLGGSSPHTNTAIVSAETIAAIDEKITQFVLGALKNIIEG